MNLRTRTIRFPQRAVVASIALLLAAGIGGFAGARPLPGLDLADVSGTGMTFAPAQRGSVSLDEAVSIAQRRNPGRVVRAETTMRNGRVVHEIRILGDDGRVVTVRVDAASGEVR